MTKLKAILTLCLLSCLGRAGWAAQPRILAELSDPGPRWTALSIAVRPAWLGASWRPWPPPLQVLAVGAAQTLEPPGLADVPGYVSGLLSLARAGKWDRLAAVARDLGADPDAFTALPAPAEAKAPDFKLAFGGVLRAGSNGQDLKRQLDRLEYLGWDCPILEVDCLWGGWQDRYDAVFEAVKGRVKPPILALCIGKMTVPELLNVPAFLRRYSGRYHSIVANHDFTNADVRGDTHSPAFCRAIGRVSLALELVRRAAPSSFVWLAVGYLHTPAWQSWIKAIGLERISGVALAGNSATFACMYPQAATETRKEFAKQLNSIPVSLIGFKHQFFNPRVLRNDDRGLQKYRALRVALNDSGLAFVHVQEGSP